ncbi:MAG TPA: permease prefix domain 1-containing protein, partial [Gemmatimonadaceae bacterium]|nr:permease prefix domain 1-containing protein [Gemmatimonadaceae bacterium]
MRENPQDSPPPRAEHARVWRRYRRFFGPTGAADLDDELRFHVDMRVAELMARGMSESAARAAVTERLGDLARTRKDCLAISNRRQRRMNRAQILDALVQDVRFAARTLGRQKGWTTVAVLTLALGIGANSAMFSVVNHLLLNPIAYPDASRIVLVYQQPTQGNNTGMNVIVTPMGRVVAAWKANAHSFEALEPYRLTDATLEKQGEAPSIVHAASILPSFSALAGQRP